MKRIFFCNSLSIALLCVNSTFAADIRYASEGRSGEYCGLGFGIDVSVAAPSSGATVRYALDPAGPWRESLLLTNACEATPVYFTIEASGYATVTNSESVTITPRELTSEFVWIELPAEDYVYDGTEKRPTPRWGDGYPSILTENDFDVAYADNVDAGTAIATFTGKRNYYGTVEEEFDILQAPNAWTTEPSIADWTYGRSPSTPVAAAKFGTWSVSYLGGSRPTQPGAYTAVFTVPGTANYTGLRKEVPFRILPATIRYASEGRSGEYCGLGFGIDVSVAAPSSGSTVRYALDPAGPWRESLLLTNACEATPVYFTIEAPGYATVTNSETVTITPKELTSEFVWIELPAEDYVYDGTEKRPTPRWGDGYPSILTEDDFDVSYADNVDAGTATATFTGKRNYYGMVEEEFDIERRPVTLVAPTKSKPYDGTPLTFVAGEIEATLNGGAPGGGPPGGRALPEGESFVYSDFASIEAVGQIEATFSYAAGPGTKLANYDVTVAPGATLTVTVAPPQSVSASDGTNEDCVEVTWTPVAGARHEVWRGAEEGAFVDAGKLGETADGAWNDATAVPGVVYRYWVRAVGGGMTSDPSTPDTGWRAISDLWIGVTKEWDDHDNEAGYRPESVSFTLLADGAEIATTNLSGGTGWTAVWTVPKYADGREVTYDVREDNLPRAYDAFVATNGLDAAHNARLDDNVLTEDGWRTLLNLPFSTPIWTISGWKNMQSIDLQAEIVMTSDRTCGTVFCVTNKYMRPTTPTDLSIEGWSGVYDGTNHSVAVSSATPGTTYRYALAETGPYSSEKPTWRDAGDLRTTWVVAEAPYFAPVTNSATVAIAKRPATVRSADATWTYDTTSHTKPEVTASGFVEGEGVTPRDFPSVTDVTPAAGVPNAFAYDWNAGTRAENYALAVEFGTLRVTSRVIGDDPANWDIRLGKNPMYDGTEKTAPIAQVCYVKPDGNLENIPYTVAGNTATNAGNYTLTITGTGNYAGSVDRGWAVMPRNLLLASGSATWPYDGAAHSEPSVTVGGDGFAEGEGADFTGFPAPVHVADATGTANNVFDIDWWANTKPSNYEVRKTYGTVAVTQRTGEGGASLVVTADSASKVYDGTALEAPGYTWTGGVLASGDRVVATVAGSQTAAGTSASTVSAWRVENAAGADVTADYATGTPVAGTLTVTKRPVTLTAPTKTKPYDGEPLTFGEGEIAVTLTGGGTPGGPALPDGESFVFSNFASQTDAGQVAATFAYAAGPGTDLANYDVTVTAGATLTVTGSATEIAVTASGGEWVYDGEPHTRHEFTTVNADTLLAGDTLAVDFDPASVITEPGETANHIVAVRVLRNGETDVTRNYTLVWYDGSLKVTPVQIAPYMALHQTVQAVYDGLTHAVIVEAPTLLTAPVAVRYGRTADGPWGDEPIAFTDAGQYETFFRVEAPHYDPFTGTATVEITPRPVSLTSASAEKAYDGEALVAHVVTVGGAGFVAGEGATYAWTGTQTERGESENTFTYALNAGTKAANYTITTSSGTLTVTALDIGGGTDDDWTVELGPSLTYNGIEQIQTVRAATFRGLPVDYAVENDRGTDAGNYELTLVGQGNFTGSKTVPWSIAPKALTLAAGSDTKMYDGTPLTCGDVTATGFVAGEGATYVCTGTQTAVGISTNEVGEIAWASGTKGTNYAVTKTAGTLTVTKRPVTLTAPTKTKPYDGEPLTFGAEEIEVTLNGGAPGGGVPGGRALPDGESFAFSDFASITDAGQCAATFAYAAGPGTDLANYDVSVAPGATLTVTGSATEITVIADSASWVYDGAAHSAPTYTTVNEDAFTAGDALVVAFADGCEATHATDGPAGDGVVTNRIASVRVLRNGETDVTRNYTIVSYDGTLRVTKRPVAVTVAGHRTQTVYDGAEDAADGYDISTDDPLYALGDVMFSGTAHAARTDAGSTAMGLSAEQFSNGNADFTVTFSVTDGGVSIAPADITGGEEGDFVVELGDNPLYNGTVQTIEVRSVTWRGLAVTYTLAGERATHAGTYAVTVKANGNFTGERTLSWAIRRRTVTLTSGSASKVYDGEPLRNGTVAVGGDGFIGSEGATYDVTGERTAAGANDNAFTYTLKAGTLASDYDITTVCGTLTVGKAVHDTSRIAWNATVETASFLYDGAEHGVALTGLPEGVTATYEEATAVDAGSYTAIAHLVYDTENYEPISDPAPLPWSISQRPITLMAASKDKPYDGWPLEVKSEDITVAGSGYAPGECFAYGDFASITDVGEIPATFSYADSDTAKVANYDVTVQGGQTLKVTVGGDQISVTADSGTWVYDGETHRLPSWTLFNGDKLLEGHVFDIAISADSAVTTPAEGAVSNRFDHVRIVDEETGRDMSRNYNLFTYEGELRVTNALIAPYMALHRTVQAVYDGEKRSAAVEAPELLRPATVRYRVGDGAWGTEAPEWTHAGEYAAEFEVSAEFYDACTGTVTVVISPRPVTLVSPTKSKPYDGTPLTFGAEEIEATLTGGPPGGRALPEGESFVYSDFASITNAGRIAATFTWRAGAGTRAGDYDVTIREGSLTVAKSSAEIAVTAKDGEWVFDGLAHSLHEWTAENLNVLADGDELDVSFDPASEITVPGMVTNAIAEVRVLRGDADVSANYTLSWWPGTLRVTPAQIAPYMALHQTEGSAVYDGAGHAVSVAAPTLLTAPVTVRYAATADGPWTSTPVAFKDAGASTAFFLVEAPSYEPYVGTTTMTISPREVTLVSAGETRVYNGTPLRKNAVSVKAGSLPFAPGEGFTAQCTGVITDVGGVENVFDYALAANTKSSNYTIRKEYGWLRVTPATMDIAALAAAASWRGPYDGEPHGASLVNPYPRAEVFYALESGNEEAYGTESPTWTNVSTNTVYFKVRAPNYEPGYGAATVAITPRDIANATIGALTNEFYTGYAIEPVPTVTDTVPITEDDWTMRWEDNIEAGTACAIVCGQRNYGGEVVREFTIKYKPEVIVVIDLSNIAVGQGHWGSALLLTNGIVVPEVRPGTRTELTVPTETAIDLTFTPDPGFRIGSVIVDNRLWTTNAVWRFDALRADKSFYAGFLPAPETTLTWTRGGDGRQYATVSIVNHAGYAEALSSPSFLFADKEWLDGSVLTTNYLITVNSKPRQPTEEHDGKTYRRVDFDGNRFGTAREGATVSFGGVNLRSDEGIARMYSRKRNLDSLVGCLALTTNGKRYYQPLVGNGAIIGLIAEDIITAEKFNQSQALGFDPAFLATAVVKCRFTDIQLDSDVASGTFEIVAVTAEGIEAESAGLDPSHTTIRLWGADALGNEWHEITGAVFDSDGGTIGFTEDESTRANAPTQFYKVTIEVDEIFE